MINLKQSIRIDFYISGERVKYIYRESGSKFNKKQHKITKKFHQFDKKKKILTILILKSS